MCMPRLRLGALIGAALFLCGVGLLIAAAATSFYYQISTSAFKLGQGLFRVCVNNEDKDNCSGMIDKNCQINAAGSIKATVMPDCDSFNAIRALLVIAVIVGGFAFLCMLYAAVGASSERAIRAGGVLAIVSAILAMISMAIGISYFDKQYSGNGFEYGHSEKIAIAGWVVELVGGAIFAIMAK